MIWEYLFITLCALVLYEKYSITIGKALIIRTNEILCFSTQEVIMLSQKLSKTSSNARRRNIKNGY